MRLQLHHTTLHYTTLHYAHYIALRLLQLQLQLQLQLPLNCTTRHYTTCTTLLALHYTRLHYTIPNYSTQHYSTLQYTTPQLQLQLHYTNHTTLQLQLHYTTLQLRLQLQLHYTTLHPPVGERWPLQTLQPLQKTQLQPPFGPSVDSLCHPWFTTTNLSYRFPIFETSATSLCGTSNLKSFRLIR